MNVSLTPELESFIADQVEKGRYRTASEAVREAVRLLQADQEEREARLERLRQAEPEVSESEVEGAWLEEAERRYQRYLSGESGAVPWSEAVARVRESLRKG